MKTVWLELLKEARGQICVDLKTFSLRQTRLLPHPQQYDIFDLQSVHVHNVFYCIKYNVPIILPATFCMITSTTNETTQTSHLIE